MNDYSKQLKKLFSHASRVRMTQEDKISLRNVILSRTGIIPIKTPYFIHMISMLSESRYAASVVALFFVFSGAVGYASNGTLPGDTLYPVKTQMTEKVEGFLVLGEKSKAQHEVKLAERRLEEATVLARSGKLETAVGVELEKNIEEHVTKASGHIEELTKTENLSDAIEITNNLQETLEVHSESLAKISESTVAIESENSGSVATLLALVVEQTQVAKETTSRVEVEIAGQAEEVETTDETNTNGDTNEEVDEFLDTEALDTLEEDFFDGDMTYKDELFITDGEIVPDDIDAPIVQTTTENPVIEPAKGPVVPPSSIAPDSQSVISEKKVEPGMDLKSFMVPFKF